jgi:hypothetical protein
MRVTTKPSGLFSIEEVPSASAGYPKELEGCDLCEHCRLRREWPSASKQPLGTDTARPGRDTC